MNRMSGEEIAQKLGISRQAVSNSLKRGMEKVFLEFKKRNKLKNDFEIAVMVLEYLNSLDGDINEIKKDFNLFPPKIKKKIIESRLKSKKDEDAEVDEINSFFGG